MYNVNKQVSSEEILKGGVPVQEFALRRVGIRDVVLGEKTEVIDHMLRIDREELVKYILEDRRLRFVEIKIARPGEKKRIIPVKDVLEPRAKSGGHRLHSQAFWARPNRWVPESLLLWTVSLW